MLKTKTNCEFHAKKQILVWGVSMQLKKLLFDILLVTTLSKNKKKEINFYFKMKLVYQIIFIFQAKT